MKYYLRKLIALIKKMQTAKMTTKFSSKLVLCLCLAIFAMSWKVTKAGDPDILSDFIIPSNLTGVDGNFFTFTAMRGIFNVPTQGFKATKASKAEFLALDGQSVSWAVLQYPAGTMNPPHTHPRSAELLFLVEGTLDVGFVDTTNKLYTQTLQPGDLFIFPKGLVHYQINTDGSNKATAASAFGSASAGTVSLPSNLFASGIPDATLANAFKTDVGTIQKITSGLAPKA